MPRIAFIVAMNILAMYVLAEEIDHYPNLFNYTIDMQELLNNVTVRDSYYFCVMETGPCPTPQHKALAGAFGEVYETNCKKCTERQKALFKEGSEWYKKNQPEQWKAAIAKVEEDMKKKKANQ